MYLQVIIIYVEHTMYLVFNVVYLKELGGWKLASFGILVLMR
jgi:hypothetical protein